VWRYHDPTIKFPSHSDEPLKPVLPGLQRKNDDIFVRGSQSALPFVEAYEQSAVEIVYGPACKPLQEIRKQVYASKTIAIVPRRGAEELWFYLPVWS